MAKNNKPRRTKSAKAKSRKNRISTTTGNRTAEIAAATEQFAYRFEGLPSDDAVVFFQKSFGCCRFIWNQMLADRNKAYLESGEIIRPTPAMYKNQFPWLREVDSLALANVQMNLESAFRKFYDGLAEFPNFKKKGKCKESYTTNIASKNATNLCLDGNMLKLPKLKSPIKLIVHRDIRPGGILKHCTVTHEPDGKWFFSLVYEYRKEDIPAKVPDMEHLTHTGLDMSLPKLYVDQAGNSPGFTHPYRVLEKRLAKEQRRLSRMKKGSHNYEDQKQKIAKLHAKAKRQRKDFLHKESTALVRANDVIGLETLDMRAIKQALRFGKSASDIGWGAFTSMLEYKAPKNNCAIVKIDKWFPSSKTCCKCGYVHKELELKDRLYICPHCGNAMERDMQAAINIDTEAMRIFKETNTVA